MLEGAAPFSIHTTIRSSEIQEMARQSYRPEVPPKDPPKGGYAVQWVDASGGTVAAGQHQSLHNTQHGGGSKGKKGQGKSFADRTKDRGTGGVGMSQPTGQLFPNRLDEDGRYPLTEGMKSDMRQQYEAIVQQQRLQQHRRQQEQIQLHYPDGMPTAESVKSRQAAARAMDGGRPSLHRRQDLHRDHDSRRPSEVLIDNVAETVNRWKQTRAEEQQVRRNEQLKAAISRPIMVNGDLTASGEKRQQERDQFWNEDKRWVKMMMRSGKLRREADGTIGARPPLKVSAYDGDGGEASTGKKSGTPTGERSFSFDKVAGAFRRRLGSRGNGGAGAGAGAGTDGTDEKKNKQQQKQVKRSKGKGQLRPETAAAAGSSTYVPGPPAQVDGFHGFAGFSFPKTDDTRDKDRTTRLGDFMVSPFFDKLKAFQSGRDRRDSDSTFFCAGLPADDNDHAEAHALAVARVDAEWHRMASPGPHVPVFLPEQQHQYQYQEDEGFRSPSPRRKRRSTFSHASPSDVVKGRDATLAALTSANLDGPFTGFDGVHCGDDYCHSFDNDNDERVNDEYQEEEEGVEHVEPARGIDFVFGTMPGGHLASVDDSEDDDVSEASNPTFMDPDYWREFAHEFLPPAKDGPSTGAGAGTGADKKLPPASSGSIPRISPVSSISPLTVHDIFASEEQGEQVPQSQLHSQSRMQARFQTRMKGRTDLTRAHALAREDSQTLPLAEDQPGQHGRYWMVETPGLGMGVGAEEELSFSESEGESEDSISAEEKERYARRQEEHRQYQRQHQQQQQRHRVPRRPVPRRREVQVRSPRCVIEPSDRYRSWYVDMEN